MASKRGTKKKTTKKRTAPKKTAAKKRAPKKAAKKATRKKATKKRAAPKKTTAKKRAPKKAAKKRASKKATKKRVPKNSAKKSSRKRASKSTNASTQTAAGLPAPTAPRVKAAAERAAAAAREPARTPRTVDSYIKELSEEHADVVDTLRDLVKGAAAGVDEAIKWAQPVYSSREGPIAYIKAHSKHINFGFWRGAELKAPRGILQGVGEKMRHMKLSSLKDIKPIVIRDMVRQAVELNRKKGDPSK